MKHLKKNILVILKNNGYSQSRLKNENILSGGTIDSLRNGNDSITVKTLIKIQDLTNASFDDFFE